jgi:hypothetical protein
MTSIRQGTFNAQRSRSQVTKRLAMIVGLTLVVGLLVWRCVGFHEEPQRIGDAYDMASQGSQPVEVWWL